MERFLEQKLGVGRVLMTTLMFSLVMFAVIKGVIIFKYMRNFEVISPRNQFEETEDDMRDHIEKSLQLMKNKYLNQ